ncbi:hypothetical protein Taro_015927 [Colocasia esculenta]|uniref:Uncharacterized protein n=1 Tax=Colocasia esculenta TaxID=4460 RepID=A0A843UIU5_COLES|nr:hypothetical protein [Colocasia esculenta]
MAETFSPWRCRPALPRACPLRRGDLLFGSAAKRTPGLPFGCAAKRSAEILTDSQFLPSIPGVERIMQVLYVADMDFIRGKLALAIIQEVNGEKENKSIGEAAVEKIVSLSDEA